VCTLDFVRPPLFVHVRERWEFPITVTPAGTPIKWGGDLGENPSFSADGTTLTASWDTLGWHMFYAICEENGGTDMIVWGVLAWPALPPPGGGGPVGDPYDRYGVPEGMPQLTFIGTEPPDGRGFLESAVNFHRKSWGLRVVRMNSLEDLVAHLAREPGSLLGRIRIVLHAFFFDEDPTKPPSGSLTLRLFRTGFRDLTIAKESLRAWAKSDGRGLSELCRLEGGDGLVDLDRDGGGGQSLSSTLSIYHHLRQN